MIVYDPRYMNWNNWCALMAELFAPQNLGTVPEEKWRDWGAALAGIGYFNSSGIPDTRGFNTWQEWAVRVVDALSVEPQTNH